LWVSKIVIFQICVATKSVLARLNTRDKIMYSWFVIIKECLTPISRKLGKEVLSSDEMIVLVLKAQTNHFAHLDKDLRSDMAELNKSISDRIEKSTTEWHEEMTALRKDMDKRFEQVDKRFEALTIRIDRFMIWSFSTSLAISAAVVAAIRYLPPDALSQLASATQLQKIRLYWRIK